MSGIELLLIGIGLSMDAFAVAVCKGLNMKKIEKLHSFVIALFFGGFQALMPLFGYILGTQFEQYIVAVDHWIAFLLLLYIGGKMIWDALKGGEDEEKSTCAGLDVKELFMLAVATSIDALAVGITFAFLKVEIFSAITVIGFTTFFLSLLGVMVGNRFGSRYQQKAQVVGGMILLLIGIKILAEHLGIFL